MELIQQVKSLKVEKAKMEVISPDLNLNINRILENQISQLKEKNEDMKDEIHVADLKTHLLEDKIAHLNLQIQKYDKENESNRKQISELKKHGKMIREQLMTINEPVEEKDMKILTLSNKIKGQTLQKVQTSINITERTIQLPVPVDQSSLVKELVNQLENENIQIQQFFKPRSSLLTHFNLNSLFDFPFNFKSGTKKI
jgi:chromosome segregation ATPase